MFCGGDCARLLPATDVLRRDSDRERNMVAELTDDDLVRCEIGLAMLESLRATELEDVYVVSGLRRMLVRGVTVVEETAVVLPAIY